MLYTKRNMHLGIVYSEKIKWFCYHFIKVITFYAFHEHSVKLENIVFIIFIKNAVNNMVIILFTV